MFTETEVPTEVSKQYAVTRAVGRFLKGPIPMSDIATAAQLPGKALPLYLAIRHQVDLTGKKIVSPPKGLLKGLGIDRDAKARALRQLEGAGLIEVVRAPGRSAREVVPISGTEWRLG